MNDLQRWLRDTDPVALEPPLDGTEVARMRECVLAAAASRAASRRLMPQYIWQGAAAVTVCVALAVVLGRTTRDVRPLPAVSPETRIAVESVRAPKQLHFSTPGGTRVIWLFDPEFEERR